MDCNRLNESPDYKPNVTSLQRLYTDFDGWVIRFNKCYTRSTYFSKEINCTTEDSEVSRQNTESADAIFENDFFSEIFLRQRHVQLSAKKPYLKFYKENDGFVFYDYVFYGLMNKNGVRMFCQQIRSKL